jgi:hypothetical protein
MITDTTPTKIKCQCGNELGEEICVEGIKLFHVGGVINRDQSGWCSNCGKPFYFYTKEESIQIIIKGMQLYKKLAEIRNAQ